MEVESKNALSIIMEKTNDDGTKIYLVKWDSEEPTEKYSWEPESTFEGHEYLISNFWLNNTGETREAGTQTPDSIWVSQEFPQFKTTDVFFNYSPNTSTVNVANLDKTDVLPIKIIDFNKEESKFLTLLSDKEEPVWCSSRLLLSFSPKLVAEYFLRKEQNQVV
ncbi:hypothetical protein GPJ56_004474 [Histomonas meleagridis]|uniref:uncharacterized protein n=1 Tax=Histomonas meleagridis TaxID=135588 RepID=UPI003559A6C7|nr:hypothetical protein GPJ56_004474 [Histomonas meleagridis]KAH0801998.1 hypothetical protein GO595_005079 [Histomonas meleagridis]